MDTALARLKDARLKATVEHKTNLDLINIENYGTVRVFDTKQGRIMDYSQIPDHFKQKIMDIVEPLKKEAVLGIDEAGKGDFFGPLVVAGVLVKDPSFIRSLGVRDSKRLKDEKIIQLSKLIQKHCPTSIVKVGPERYNEMYEKIRNLNTLLAWGHATAIENVLKMEQPEYVISDKFADEKVLMSELKEQGKKIKLVQRVRAEEHTSVAAASIVARAEFVLGLQNLSFKYGMELPLGAGEPVISAANVFVEKFGKDELGKICKQHFRTFAGIPSQ